MIKCSYCGDFIFLMAKATYNASSIRLQVELVHLSIFLRFALIKDGMQIFEIEQQCQETPEVPTADQKLRGVADALEQRWQRPERGRRSEPDRTPHLPNRRLRRTSHWSTVSQSHYVKCLKYLDKS